MQEAILKVIREGGDAFLSLFDLEKTYDSLGHSCSLDSLFDAGIKGTTWRIISFTQITLNAVVKSGCSLFGPIE